MNQLGQFEQNLLTELREVVSEQAAIPQPRRALPRKRLTLAAAGGGLLATGLLVGIPAMNGDQTPAAYAVTTNDDGTVTVVVGRINDTEAAEGLERELEAHGVAAEIDYAPPGKKCRDAPPRYDEPARHERGGPEREPDPKGIGIEMPYLGAPNSLGKENIMILRPAVLEGRTVVVEILDDSLSPSSYLAAFKVGLTDGPVAPCVLVDEE